MHDKFEKKMLKTRKRESVYIIKKIVKDLDEFILFLIMRRDFTSLININIIFLSVNKVVKFTFTDLININNC